MCTPIFLRATAATAGRNSQGRISQEANEPGGERDKGRTSQGRTRTSKAVKKP